MYRIFTRDWWRNNKDWPNGLEPYAGKKRTRGHANTESDARAFCMTWNACHEPGRLSNKAEYESM